MEIVVLTVFDQQLFGQFFGRASRTIKYHFLVENDHNIGVAVAAADSPLKK